MADLFVGDLPILRAKIFARRSACWWADVVLDGDIAPSGAAAIHDGAGTEYFRGTIASSGVVHGRVELRVLPGAARIHLSVAARFYSGPTVTIGMVVNDLMRDAGETLSTTVAATVLSRPLGQWTREAVPAVDALRALADFTGLEWRTLADGTYWLGVERWLSVDAYVDAPALEDHPNDGTMTLGPDAIVPQLVPGTTLGGRRVSVVEHNISGRRLRTFLLFEEPGDYDIIQRRRVSTLRADSWRVDYLALCPARVVQQDADGTLHVVPVRFDRDGGGSPVMVDDPRLPPMTGVPIRTFVPGAVVTLNFPTDGSVIRVLVGFEGGDPSRPYAALWDAPDVTLESLTIGNPTTAQPIARKTDSVDAASDFTTWLAAIATAFNSLGHPLARPTPPTAIGTISSGSALVKAQ